MKKILIIVLHIFLANLCFAQNQAPLTVREAYNFAVRDTFQYYNFNIGLNSYVPTYSQIVILDKALDSLNQQYVYTQQIERFTPAFSPDNIHFINVIYTKSTELFKTRHWDSSSYTNLLCKIVTNPSTTNYCYDSLAMDYGNRKTLKHEFNYNLSQTGKIHYAAGLGQTLDYYSSEEMYSTRTYKMIFYNKSGQTWGVRTDIFDIQKDTCKPLTMREVYDFDEGNIFTYKTVLYRIPPGRLDTLYERQTVLKKSLFLPDSIVYILKKESAYTSAFTQLMLKTDTFVVKNLDSSVVNDLKGDPQRYIYTQDVCQNFSLCNTKRKEYGRRLYSDRIVDLGNNHKYGLGIGLTFFDGSSITPFTQALIYYKKGIEICGTPISFPTSISAPSVFDLKIKYFPNPTNDILNIETDLSNFDIKISNLSGQLVLKSQNTAAINIRHLPNGLYFLQVFEGVILRGVNKFVVQH